MLFSDNAILDQVFKKDYRMARQRLASSALMVQAFAFSSFAFGCTVNSTPSTPTFWAVLRPRTPTETWL
jgi:hypothetical protein